jgi:hypothetical protein
VSDVDWDAYAELLEDEAALYAEMQEARNPTVGRVYPTRVKKAERAWEAAARLRQARNKELAVVLQVPSSKVSLLYYQHRLKENA